MVPQAPELEPPLPLLPPEPLPPPEPGAPPLLEPPLGVAPPPLPELPLEPLPPPFPAGTRRAAAAEPPLGVAPPPLPELPPEPMIVPPEPALPPLPGRDAPPSVQPLSVNRETTSQPGRRSNERMVRSIRSQFTDDDPPSVRPEIDATEDARIALDHVDGAVLVIVVGHTHPVAAFVDRPEHTLLPVHLPRQKYGRILRARGRLADPHAVALVN